MIIDLTQRQLEFGIIFLRQSNSEMTHRIDN